MGDATSESTLQPPLATMLEAHVRFELDRLRGEELTQSIRDEVAVLLRWLDDVPLSAVATPESAGRIVRELVLQGPVSDEMRQTVGHVAALVHARLSEDDTALGELLGEQDYDRAVRIIVGMRAVQEEILEQLTESTVYSQLVAHVVYHGVKSYLLTENVVARKVPGASSLVRLGQKGLSTAAPKLEQNIDAQLIAFVNANIADTVKDSRRYLDALLDENVLASVATEIRAGNAERSLASAAALVQEDEVASAAEVGMDIWLHLRGTPLVARLVDAAVAEVFERYQDRTVGALLTELGITTERATATAMEMLEPAVREALDSGYLEERLRARLGAFYRSYMPEAAVSLPRQAQPEPDPGPPAGSR